VADIVREIRDEVRSQLSTLLPSTFKELDYSISPAKNNFRGNSERFGVTPQGAVEVPGTTTFVTMDQEFTIVLTNGFTANRDNDTVQLDQGLDLYEQMDSIQRQLIKVKAGGANILLSTILQVSDFSISDPEYLEVEKVVILEATMLVRYRKSIT